MRKFGLIGFPLSHSFSPCYFKSKFETLGISDAQYDAYPIDSLQKLNDLIKYENLLGLNVTIPYKQEVMQFVEELDEVSIQIGAVNTLKIIDGKIYGYNTDAYGFGQSLIPYYRSHLKNALILGTGGASKSVEYVLKKLKINYKLVSRNPSHENQIDYSQITPDLLRTSFLIINTTPLGMSPEINTFPLIDYESLSPNHLLYDLVYNPLETMFLKQGRERGCKTVNGLRMLELQADKSWEIWNSIN